MRHFAWLFAVILLAACGSTHDPSDGGSGTDGSTVDGGALDGSIGTDAGPAACGFGTCAAAEICCAGCGSDYFCEASSVCPDISCTPDCTDGVGCDAAAYCDYPVGVCGGDGFCRTRPTGCPEDCPGVCGCDGTTYCNDCMAAASGADTDHAGACSTPGDCDAMDAMSMGFCELLVGFAWDGTSCEAINCACVGTDCASVFGDLGACNAAYAGCMSTGRSCGGFAGDVCASTEWCDYPEGALCGATDATGTCRPRPEACVDIFDPVCGCNGMTYSNACDANAAGQDVASRGMCGSTDV